jgi:hypothetical protein
MKKTSLATVLLGLSLPVMAQAVEFQPIGALGMGGAGVARNNGALTAYWNPAGGAFNESPFAMHVGVGIGAKGSDGLAENVDRLSDVDFDSVKNFDSNKANATTVGDMVKAITVIKDIEKRQGNISLNSQVPVGFSIKHLSFGLYGNFEGYILPKTDSFNIIPQNETLGTTTTNVNVIDLYNAAVTPTTPSTSAGYFTPTQFSTLAAQFVTSSPSSNKLNLTQAGQLVNAIETQVQSSGIPAETTYSSLITFVPSLAAGGTNTFDKNTTSVLTKALTYYEVPLSYGHPFDFGNYGKLGVGATAKIISGAVYQNQVLLVNRPEGDEAGSGDLLKDLTKNSETSVNFGIDLGALYKYDKWLSVGVVAKNLNSPKFKAPDYQVPVYDATTKKIVSSSTAIAGEDVKLKPQMRAGVAFDPFSWLTIASDLDLTNNDTIAPGTVLGSSVKSRNFGGGLEVHPYSWLRVRGGAYKNLANSDMGTILTAGLTLFVLDIDGAFATDTFKLNDKSIPQEAKVQVSMSFAF